MSGRARPAVLAVVFSAGMAVFAYSAFCPALKATRWGGLAVAALALGLGLAGASRPAAIMGLQPFPAKRWPWLMVSAGLGAALAAAYRLARQEPVLPVALAWPAAVTAAIGACEELAYRGFVQGCLRGFGAAGACLAAAAAHAAYKTTLLGAPGGAERANLFWLAGATLLVGAGFGLLRERLGSVVFPVAAHAAFDVAAYGDWTHLPWWVR